MLAKMNVLLRIKAFVTYKNEKGTIKSDFSLPQICTIIWAQREDMVFMLMHELETPEEKPTSLF